MKPYPHNTDYLVSKDGRVWSTKGRGRFRKTHIDDTGHPQIGLSCKGIRKTIRVHRMVLETYVGDCPAGMMCRHLDGNAHNNNINNLCWGTSKENHTDRVKHYFERKSCIKTMSQNSPKRLRFDCNAIKRFIGSRLPVKTLGH